MKINLISYAKLAWYGMWFEDSETQKLREENEDGRCTILGILHLRFGT